MHLELDSPPNILLNCKNCSFAADSRNHIKCARMFAQGAKGAVGSALIVESESDTSRAELVGASTTLPLAIVDNILVIIIAHSAERY